MIDDPATRIERLMAHAEPELRDQFLAVVAAIKGAFTLNEIVLLLEQGRTEDALRVVEAAAKTMGVVWSRNYTNAATSTANWLNKNVGEIEISFDQVNWRAVEQMRLNQLRLVRNFTDQQRDATREALRGGVEEGINPREMALRFRESIGLTPYQQRAVNNYRRALQTLDRDALDRKLRDRRFDPTVESAIRSGTPLTRAQIDKMVARYNQRMVNHRAEVIARTEALRSVHLGVEEAYEQALQSGELDPRQLIRTWNTAMDARVRDSHGAMNQQQRHIGEPFRSGAGNSLRYPGDINAPASETIQCRCAVSTRILDLSEIEDTVATVVMMEETV